METRANTTKKASAPVKRASVWIDRKGYQGAHSKGKTTRAHRVIMEKHTAKHEYQCRKCGEIFMLSTDEAYVCPDCNRPTLRDHIRDLNDAATRFEDRAKRSEAHADALAEALRDFLKVVRTSNIDRSATHEGLTNCDAISVASKALADWEGAQS